MSYAILSDELLLQMESAGLDRDARLLHVEAIVYCATALTDGAVRIRLARISDAPDPDAAAHDLVAAGLWESVGGGYRIVNYLSTEGGHQRSAEQVEKDRQANRKRQDDYRERGRLHKMGDHSKCTKSCPDAPRNGVTNGVSNGPLSIPSLTEPKRGKGKGRRAAVALERADDPASETDDGHGFDGDADTPSCDTCGLPEGNGRHGYLPPEAEHIIGLIKARGGQLYDASYCPARDNDDFPTWTVIAEIGDLTVTCESRDCDPYTFGRLSEVLVQFSCTPAQSDRIKAISAGWPSTTAERHERGHCNVVTETLGADLLSSVEVIIDRVIEARRQVMAA